MFLSNTRFGNLNNLIFEEEYKEVLALSLLALRPLAAQLGIYLGYLYGATLVGIAFVLSSFLMVVIIGMRSITDFPIALIAIAALFVLLYIEKPQEPYIILIAAVIGLISNIVF